MVRIRLARHGRKAKPYYHVVAADSKSPRDGKFLEKLGKYDPNCEPSFFEINKDRVQHWYGLGASLSHPVKVMLKKHKITLIRNS